jgi:sulfite exporter TauE/SafE
MQENNSTTKYLLWTLGGMIMLIGFLMFRINSLEHPSTAVAVAAQTTQFSNLWAIFLTGLFVGGLTCMAVQGGLLAATIAQREEARLKDKVKQGGAAFPIITFLIAKLAAYTVLGFMLGWLGSAFQLSLTVKIILNFAVVIFMVGTALNILNVHPIFRYFVIQPPKFLTRLVRKQSKSKDAFAPALLGAFTVFIPCGTTQAMMALAIASGKPLSGAAILFAFILGTSPLFFLLGYMAMKLGDRLHKQFMRFAAFAIILLAIFNLNNAIALTGSNFTLNNLFSDLWCTVSVCGNTTTRANTQAANNNVAVAITANGYNPDNLTVKAGSQVTLHLTNTGGQGCTQAFTIPSMGIQKVVPLGNSDTIAFTAPSQPGDIPFMCSMGMYRGVMHVI